MSRDNWADDIGQSIYVLCTYIVGTTMSPQIYAQPRRRARVPPRRVIQPAAGNVRGEIAPDPTVASHGRPQTSSRTNYYVSEERRVSMVDAQESRL